MKDKIVHHIALDIWAKLQDVRHELNQLRQKDDIRSNPNLELDIKVAEETLTEARKLVALLTKQDYDVDNGD